MTLSKQQYAVLDFLYKNPHATRTEIINHFGVDNKRKTNEVLISLYELDLVVWYNRNGIETDYFPSSTSYRLTIDGEGTLEERKSIDRRLKINTVISVLALIIAALSALSDIVS